MGNWGRGVIGPDKGTRDQGNPKIYLT